MDTKIAATLEYPKVLQKLSQHASTALGRTRAEQLQPSTELEAVKKLLQATDEAYAADRLKGNGPFSGITDVTTALQRARIGGTLSPAELLSIALTSKGGRRVKRHIIVIDEDHPLPLLTSWAETIVDCRELDEEIFSCIDDQAEVLDSASPELAAIRRELRGGEARIRERLEQMIRSSSVQKMLQETLITLRNDRYVIPVKQEYRSHFGGIIHDQSGSGATLFIEPEAIVAMNNKLRELYAAEDREIDRILQRLTARAADFEYDLLHNLAMLGELDFAYAKARLAHEMKAALPRMNDRGFLRLKRARHPLIASDKVVPIDIELGNNYTAIIVTGPNTGGKTVSLKTVGLLSLMAMSGLFVPAEDGSQLCVFDGIFADIGDEQSIEQSLSTFSSHLTNIIRILGTITPKSLVLLDELGAGTDPAEGSALAIAMLEHIHKLGCRIMATTHYSELKAYAEGSRGVVNASMEFDVATLSPTYRLLVGVPGRSNAFAIAKRLGLPQEIIAHAQGQVSEEDKRVETMLASLEENRLSAETDRHSAQQMREQMEAMRKKLEAEQEKWEEQKLKLQQKAQEEAREAVVKARREAEQIIADLRKLALEEGASVKEHKLIEAKRQLDAAVPERVVPVKSAGAKRKPIVAGDDVKVLSLNQKGIVLELQGSEALVQIGIMKMKVAIHDLESLQQQGGNGNYSQVGAGNGAAKEASASSGKLGTLQRTKADQLRMELDLRGENVEEAIMEVDRFIDEAYLAGLGQVFIIHGKGTGVLRTGIQQYLRNHRLVKSYRLGEFGEGGTGVTVAVLN